MPRGFDGTPGPWFDAIYPGECVRCGERFPHRQQIRADGHGSYECCTGGDAEPEDPAVRTRFAGTSLDDMGY